MSFKFNSDNERISGVNPSIYGSSEFTIRTGAGAQEREIFRAQLSETALPRVGINRTGRRVERITLLSAGNGYTLPPTVELSPPTRAPFIQAQASAAIVNGSVTAIVVDNPGDGYETAPTVTFDGGGGVGVAAEAFLDEVLFELDVNGAVRTSTSIISDTARILNLDIDNFVTADANFRAPNLKTFQNNTGTPWAQSTIVQVGDYRYHETNVYQVTTAGLTSNTPPDHIDGIEANGDAQLKHIGFRVNDQNQPYFAQTGEAGIFPRSITPKLGDRSDKIATTEYVLNLATNDVGGRIYVSQQIGDDLNDGRSAVNPVRTIKRACQIAWSTPGVKETVIISGGDYVEDNPVSIPPDCSIVGDNLRLVIVRPQNARKHVFKFGDKNYLTGITFRDQIDSNGDPVATWDFAMVFDDKQRVYFDKASGGDFGRTLPIGHQIFGPPRIEVTFQTNTGLANLVNGLPVRGVNTGATGQLFELSFDETTGPNAYINGKASVDITNGTFSTGETFQYGGDGTLKFIEETAVTAGQLLWAIGNVYTVTASGTTGTSIPTHTSGAVNNGTAELTYLRDAYEFVSTDIKSIRAEGEVVETGTDYSTTLPITRIDFSKQGTAEAAQNGFGSEVEGNAEDLGGIIFYTNDLVGRSNVHDFKEGQEIEITGLPTSGPDLSFLNGKQRIYKILRDADGRSRRFVIPKKTTVLTTDNYQPTGVVEVKSAMSYMTLSLLNSPNKFSRAAYVSRRYQDACNLIRNNIEFIKDEVVLKLNDQFAKKHFAVEGVDTSLNTFQVRTNPNDFVHTYVSGGTVTFEGTEYSVTGFVYDNTTGIGTVTTAGIPGLKDGKVVKIEDIVISCSQGQKIYPGFNIPGGDSKCYRDVGHFVNAILMDLEYGSNAHVIEAANYYIAGARVDYVDNEIIQTVRAFEYARQLIILAMRNWITGDGTSDNPEYVPEYSALGRYKDPTVISTTAGTPVCADVEASINTLVFLFNDILANNTNGTYLDAAYLIARNKTLIADQAYRDAISFYPALKLSTDRAYKCKRDIELVLSGLVRDLALGGNGGIVNAAENYYTGQALTGVPEAQLGATIYAFRQARKYARQAMRNWTNGNYFQVTPSTATYDSTTGDVVLTVTTSGLTFVPVANRDRVAFKEGALTFTCDPGGGAGTHASPTPTDRNYGKSTLITNVSTSGANTLITVNVGDAGTATGVAHTFASALANGTFIVPEEIDLDSPFTASRFEDWNILPDVNADLEELFTPSNATYDPATGNFDVTVTGHGLTGSGNSMRIAPQSFTFTCAMDSNKTEHYLPGAGQTAFDSDLPVTVVDANTLRVNVGASAADVQFTPTAATYDPASGELTLTIGTHSLYIGAGIVLDDNSLSFTCDMDGNQSTKTYPRPGIDPFAGRSIPISAVTDTTITINAGKSADNVDFQPTSGSYDSGSGDLVLDIGQHGLGVGRGVILTDNSLTFDGGLLPRPGVDSFSGQSLSITSVGSSDHTVTDAVYDAMIGVVTLTIASHNFTEGDYIKVDDSSLTFSCQPEGESSPINKSYPRAGYDYPSGRWLPIKNVTTNTFDIEVGPSAYTGAHTFVSATTNGVKRQNGQITVNITSGIAGYATLLTATADAVRHLPQSAHTFVSATSNSVKHLPQSAHTFVRTQNNSIAIYTTGDQPMCNNVATTINTSMLLLEQILDGTILPGATTRTYGTLFDTTNILTRPNNHLYDQDNKIITPTTTYDDLPIIEASPYTQNASVISFLGGGGAEIDGDKVAQPNSPFPGLELDGTASFPNQGKSMVAAAFTIITFGGTGYKVVNDGYTQLVSVFVIFAENGVLSESGGYASITNSATNFGTFALRARGFRKDAYEFDQGYTTGGGTYIRATIASVSNTVTGRTIINVENLGRRPLEDYIVKVDGYRNADPDDEYFIESLTGGTVGPPFNSALTLDNGTGDALELIDEATDQVVLGTDLVAYNVANYGSNPKVSLHRPSIVNSSSHTWEFAGSGTNYNALPENGGVKVDANEQVSEDYGRVYVSGTDELGDFKVGTFAKIENRTGAITFTGTVTISEVEFLKLKGGDVVVTGFDASNTLGGANSSDSKIPTQKAVKDFITNNLGPYINKPYSTNAVPRALVELTDSGKISLDQIPALRPFSVYTVADQAARISENTIYGDSGALAGDIVIQNDTSQSFILNDDTESQFLAFNENPALAFTVNDVYVSRDSGGSLGGSGSQIQATEYRAGVVYKVNITAGGSGYVSTPTVTVTPSDGGTPTQAADVTATIANGSVISLTINLFNGYVGGLGYTANPNITIDAPGGGGTQATATALIESRLYGDIVNSVKMEDTDFIDDDNGATVNLTRVYNTSSTNAANWVALSSNQIAASDITSGIISTSRLAQNSAAANSFTFLRGDQAFAPVMQSLKGAETRYFAITSATGAINSSTLSFATNSDVLKGHEVINNVPGIQADTLITNVVTSAGTTEISLDKTLTQEIPSGTVIEFERGSSPLVLESTFTIGAFVDNIILSNQGTGYTPGTYNDTPLTGGNGSGLKANITVNGTGNITTIVVTDGGSGYTTGDFTVTSLPPQLGAGSNAVLLAKVGEVTRNYANTTIDVKRVTEQTISQDLYGTVGVSRFKKSQFNVGLDGNGSVELKTGDGSNLNADLLDGFQGTYYTNASNLSAGLLATDRLSGTYNINISGSSGNTLRLNTDVGALSSSSNPSQFPAGFKAETKNNSADGLDDGGIRHLVLTARNGASGTDATYGGVRQLAFTDNNNLWIRGSGTTPANNFGSWYKVWTSLNDGVDTGLDADKLDNKQGKWYQTAYNINFGILSTNRIPEYLDETNVKDSLTIRKINNFEYYEVYVPGQLLTGLPFIDNGSFQVVNLYDSTSNAVGSFQITNIITNDEIPVPPNPASAEDTSGDYSIIIGYITNGGFTGALTIGSASNRPPFADYRIILPPNNETTQTVYEGAKLEDGKLTLGRKDDPAGGTTPSVEFRSGSTSVTYDSRIIASGGNGSNGGGTLDVEVVNNDSFTVNNNVVFNAANLLFDDGLDGNNPVGYDTSANGKLVARDSNGNFAAGTITATLDGAATGNLPITGGTLDGDLTIGNATTRLLTVNGDVDVTDTLDVEGIFRVDSTNNLIYADQANGNVLVGAPPSATPSQNGKFNILTNGGDARNALTIRVGDNDQENGIAFQNSGYAYTWNIFRAPSDYGSNDPATTSLADLYFNGAAGGGADSNINGLSTSLLLRAGGDIETGTGKVGIGQSPLNIPYKLSVNGQVHTENGSAISYSDQDAYLVFFNDKEIDTANNNGNSNYYNVNVFVAEKTGDLRIKWSTKIDSGFYGYRISVNGTPVITDDYNSVTYLDGNAANATAYRNFSAAITNLNPGDVIEFAMTVTNSGGTAINGTASNVLSCRNFRVYSGTPHHANPHGGNTFIGNDQIGIGTSSFVNGNTEYSLNVAGNVNFSGILYQNDSEFVTSRWTENGTNIYRNSRVGIGETTPAYTLDVGEDFTDNGESGRLRVQGTSRLEGALTITTGGADVTGVINAKSGLQANGSAQWLDSNGIIKASGSTISENVTIPAGTNAFSTGDVVIASGNTIIVNGIWQIL